MIPSAGEKLGRPSFGSDRNSLSQSLGQITSSEDNPACNMQFHRKYANHVDSFDLIRRYAAYIGTYRRFGTNYPSRL